MNITQTDNLVAVPKQLRMKPEVFARIRETIGMRKAETGGILGGCRETGEVTHFFFDEAASGQSGVAYTPNNTTLNNVLKTEWRPQGIDYVGSIHSHPPYYRRPSSGDEVYAKRILEALDLPYLLVPIVTTIADTGTFQVHPYAAVRDGNTVEIIEQDLLIGSEPVAREIEHLLSIPEPVALPWEILVLISCAGLLATGIATAQLIRSLRYYRKLNEGE